MQVGVIKEIKDKENRVALTPPGAAALVRAGHKVRVQAGAGVGSGFADQEYLDAGAETVAAAQAWEWQLCGEPSKISMVISTSRVKKEKERHSVYIFRHPENNCPEYGPLWPSRTIRAMENPYWL